MSPETLSLRDRIYLLFLSIYEGIIYLLVFLKEVFTKLFEKMTDPNDVLNLITIQAVFGVILNYLAYAFLGMEISLKYIIAFGALYYFVWEEFPIWVGRCLKNTRRNN